MVDTLTLFDVPSGGKVRHRDPVTSVHAARKVSPGAEEAVYVAHCRFPAGLWADRLGEVIDGPWKASTLISARSRLAKRGVVSGTGRVVDGQEVYVVGYETVRVTGGRL